MVTGRQLHRRSFLYYNFMIAFYQDIIKDLFFVPVSRRLLVTIHGQLRACLKIHSWHLHAPLRGIFGPNSGYIAHYAPFIWPKSPTKWNAQLPESNFQTRSRVSGSETRNPGEPFSRAYLSEQPPVSCYDCYCSRGTFSCPATQDKKHRTTRRPPDVENSKK